MTTPAELVEAQFALARDYADDSLESLSTFLDAMSSNLFAPPTIDVTWESITAPEALAIPVRPASLESIEADLTWDQDGSISGARPAALDVGAAPDLTIDDFTEEAPVTAFPVAPTPTYGDVPVVPTPDAVTLPDAPTLDVVVAPSLLALSTPTFSGLDLHTDLQLPLQEELTLTLVAPTAYTYTPGDAYASDLLTSLKAKLLERMSGGTGLPAAVEAAIWDRARDREVATWQANIDEAQGVSEAQGFQLPSGVLAAQLRRAQVAYYDKVSGFSRDVALKQADLEQLNLRETITAGLQLESKLIDYSYQLERIAFESAQKVADNAIQLYNAQVEKFKALIEARRAYISAYQAIIAAEQLAIEELKAKIALENAKADFNKAAVEAYKAQIEASEARVKIYEAQVGAAKTLVELEGAKIAAAEAQIRGFIAQVNAETAKVEAYKAAVDAEATKVTVYKTKAEAFTAKVNGQAERARAQVSYYEARVRAYATEWDAWRARVAGEAERFRALQAKFDAVLTGYKVDIASYEAQSGVALKQWETQIKQYEAQATYTMNGQKLNADVFIAARNAQLEASKVAAQAYSQLTASAWSIIHASAGVSASGSNSVSYSYSNDTDIAPPAVTAV